MKTQSEKKIGKNSHKPVMVNEVIEALNIQPNGFYVDATLGRAGHAQMIIKKLDKKGRLLVIDKDPEAISHAKKLFSEDDRIIIRQGSFAKLKEFCTELNWLNKVNGILIDLGVSSPQLDTHARGFSFQASGPLDMRMDNTSGMTAAEWLNTAEEADIAAVLKTLGEERFHKRIAHAIVLARSSAPLTDTLELAEIVKKANPAWEKHKHPATRSFQAIRIYINNELEDLTACLTQCLEVLAPYGRLAVISFHSLEDRIVKQFIHFNVKDAEPKTLLHIIKKQKASNDETAENPRARSALLRVAERVSEVDISIQENLRNKYPKNKNAYKGDNRHSTPGFDAAAKAIQSKYQLRKMKKDNDNDREHF